LAGADVTMIASALYEHGPNHVRVMLDGLREWMVEKEHASVSQMKGSLSLINAPDPSAFERANYIKTLVRFTGTGATARSAVGPLDKDTLPDECEHNADGVRAQ
jgi:hypothetical protein